MREKEKTQLKNQKTKTKFNERKNALGCESPHRTSGAVNGLFSSHTLEWLGPSSGLTTRLGCPTELEWGGKKSLSWLMTVVFKSRFFGQKNVQRVFFYIFVFFTTLFFFFRILCATRLGFWGSSFSILLASNITNLPGGGEILNFVSSWKLVSVTWVCGPLYPVSGPLLLMNALLINQFLLRRAF